MSEGFAGFSSTALAFLAELPSHDKAWFDENRGTYTSEVAEPAKAFVEPVAEALRSEVSAGIVGEPKVNGSISPINNDIRFSADKTPYKDHLLFKWWEGTEKKTAPTLWLRLGRADVGLATGIVLPPDRLPHWRQVVGPDDPGAELAWAIDSLVSATGADVIGAEYKQVPKPFEPDHPRADLLRHKWLQVRWLVPLPEAVSSPEFVEWCVGRLVAAGDVHRWLVRHM